jgi:hypothetical protein
MTCASQQFALANDRAFTKPFLCSMTLLQVTKQSLALLRRILERERGRFAKEDLPFTSSPPAFIYLHARNISELGDDVVALEAVNRSRAARILVRPMLESLFSLVAAGNPTFPARKIVAEQEDEIERIKVWSEEDHDHEFRDKLKEAKQQVRHLRLKHSITEKKKWNARETAQEAALDWHYKRDYFSCGGNIHSKAGCLMFYERQLESEISLISTVFIVLTTVDLY